MDSPELSAALDCLTVQGGALRERYRYEWPRQAQEAVSVLIYQWNDRQASGGPHRGPCGGAETEREGRGLSLVAVVGGASSGKSTIFNNLLGGRLASRVTARGHATLGPIAAVHESRREQIEQARAAGLFWPTFAARVGSLDDNTPGAPDALHLVYHPVDALRDLVLFDMPDLTSEPARTEGDIAHGTLPWFDRLMVVVDHERWFDRQTIALLHDESAQYGQERFAIFNRDQEGDLDEEQLARLLRQAKRLGAAEHLVLEFRQGRGCVTFPPATFDRLVKRLAQAPPNRCTALTRYLGRLSRKIINNNAERRARLTKLREALDRAVSREIPSAADCLTTLLTKDESRHLDIISRTLRLAETRQWFSRQVGRARDGLRRHVPFLGLMPGRAAEPDLNPPATGADRPTIGWEDYRGRSLRILGRVDAAASDSDFWLEVRRWTSAEPPPAPRELLDQRRESVRNVVAVMDEAIRDWTAKVDSECHGVSPRLVGAVGAGTLAAVILLAAVAGPITALTWPLIAAKLGGALGTLAASVGAGVVAGPSAGRLLAVIRERLIGGPEFASVKQAMEAYRELIIATGQDAAEAAYAAAQTLVIDESGELAKSLNILCDAAEVDE